MVLNRACGWRSQAEGGCRVLIGGLRLGLVSASLALTAFAPCRELPQGLVKGLEKAGVLKGAIYPWESTEDQVIAIACRVGSANVMALIGLGKPIPGGCTIASGSEGETRLRIARRQLPNLKRLIAVSARVLSKHGVDARKLRTDLSRAQRALPELISKQSARYVPDIPETHLWYEHRSTLFKLDLLPDQSIPLLRGPWPWSRLEFAVAARTAAHTLPTVVRRLVRKKCFVEAVGAIEALINKFESELRALGHSPARLLLTIELAIARERSSSSRDFLTTIR